MDGWDDYAAKTKVPGVGDIAESAKQPCHPAARWAATTRSWRAVGRRGP